jgi:tetratricopeptide (TPR) repeat protein
MTCEADQPGIRNDISGGLFAGPVLQGRDNLVTVQSRAPVPQALAQLPATTRVFTGRGEDLAILADLLNPARDRGTVVVSAVASLAGVGKTTLAIHAAHAAVDSGWFTGGVLFTDLHGYDNEPVQPAQALDALLRALGIPAEHIPPTADERAALYRSALAQITSPVLIIADNASTDTQVKPLLPGSGPHKVLVTSRDTLAVLGARLIDITTLDQDASIELLNAALRAARAGDDRIAADPDAARQLASACGGLPLALQITAALLSIDPVLSTAELAAELADETRRLETLQYDDGSGAAAPSVAAAFGLSYQRLSPDLQRMFRLLSLVPGSDLSTQTAAIITDVAVTDARKSLTRLLRAHLIEPSPAGPGRWRMHDLVRLYAGRLSSQHADPASRETARERLLWYYLQTADAADDHLRAPSGISAPDKFASRDDALAWLDAERPALIAAVTMAQDTGHDEIAMRLPLTLGVYLDWRRRFDDLLTITATSLKAARRLGDRNREAAALNNLSNALQEVRRFDEAITTLQDAAAVFRNTGDLHSEAMALNNLGAALRAVGQYDEAITTHQDAVAIYRDAADRHGEAGALNNLGNALREVRRYDEAITAHQNAAEIFSQTDDEHGQAKALNNLQAALAARAAADGER